MLNATSRRCHGENWGCLIALIVAVCLIPAPGFAQTKPINRVTFVTCYDHSFFYVAAVIHKPQLAGADRTPFGDPLSDDCFMVSLQVGPVNQPHRTASSVSMAVSVAGGAELYRGADATPLAGPQDFKLNSAGEPAVFKYGTTHQGAINAATPDDDSYTVEIGIPWAEVGGEPPVGSRLKFNVAALSHAPGSPPLESWAPAVKSAADLNNPTDWGTLILSASPLATGTGQPGVVDCPQVYSSPPIVDGVMSPGEWDVRDEITYGPVGGPVEAAPTETTPGRQRLPFQILPPTPALPLPTHPLPTLKPLAPQPVGPLTIATYSYRFQGDPERSDPLDGIRFANGSNTLLFHPLAGCGPWFSYDRVGWQAHQLSDLSHSGIDVALVAYQGDLSACTTYSTKGLLTLAAALQSLEMAHRQYPQIALDLDTASLEKALHRQPNLDNPEDQAVLYGMIQNFYRNIPDRFRASVQLDSANGGRRANIVYLSSAAPLGAMSGRFILYCREHYAAEFGGNDLIFIGDRSFIGKAPLDGYADLPTTQADSPASADSSSTPQKSGWIPLAVVNSQDAQTVVASTQVYQQSWRRALEAIGPASQKSGWIIVNGWNDYGSGAAVAPTMEMGVALRAITQVMARLDTLGGDPFTAQCLWQNIPLNVAAGSAFSAQARILNSGDQTWIPGQFALVAKWETMSGRPISPATTTAAIPPPPILHLTTPDSAINVSTPVSTAGLSPGTYRLSIQLKPLGPEPVLKGARKNKTTAVAPPAAIPIATATVTILNAPASVSFRILRCELPILLETGNQYPAKITIENTGSTAWQPTDDWHLAARIYRYRSPIGGSNSAPEEERVANSDSRAEIGKPVQPGQSITLTVPVSLVGPDGESLPAWKTISPWQYEIRWELSGKPGGAVASPMMVGIEGDSFGVQFLADYTPPTLPAGKRMPVKLSLRNIGRQTWLKSDVRVGAHWFYLDGTEAIWQDETTPLPQNVAPGETISDFLAWVTPPPYDGEYYLEWDVIVGNKWASTIGGSNVGDVSVDLVRVVDGRLRMVNLDKYFTISGISGNYNRLAGDFDPSGASFPAPLMPPYVTGDTAPDTIWQPEAKSGLDSPRHISFLFPPKLAGQKNFVTCNGQKIIINPPPAKGEKDAVVHILAASIKPDVLGGFTLDFQDGSQQYSSFTFSSWDSPPQHAEDVGLFVPYRMTPSGPDMKDPAYLFDYRIKLGDSKPLVAIELPKQPAIRIAAITIEKQ